MASPTVFIKGAHYFCDHRCWRCPLSNRCEVYSRVVQQSRPPVGGSPVGRVAAVVLTSVQLTIEQTGELLREAPVDMPSMPDMPNHEEIEAADARHDREVKRDVLVVRGKEYAQGALRVLQALRPSIAKARDADAQDACDRLEETCLTVASKIYRAISSRSNDPDAFAAPQDDANGSAKVALLLIDESRHAWRVLAAPGRSVGNGAPRGFISTLDALETGLLERFPDAFAFIRPGFDTGEADPQTAQMTRALLGTSALKQEN